MCYSTIGHVRSRGKEDQRQLTGNAADHSGSIRP
jgi:hypothetical protein